MRKLLRSCSKKGIRSSTHWILGYASHTLKLSRILKCSRKCHWSILARKLCWKCFPLYRASAAGAISDMVPPLYSPTRSKVVRPIWHNYHANQSTLPCRYPYAGPYTFARLSRVGETLPGEQRHVAHCHGFDVYTTFPPASHTVRAHCVFTFSAYNRSSHSSTTPERL